jgi:hypothetical protein
MGSKRKTAANEAAAFTSGHDRFADPKFIQFAADWKCRAICGFGRPARPSNAGVEIPKDWPDPLRDQDQGKPDIGALPFGAQPLQVGPSADPSRTLPP